MEYIGVIISLIAITIIVIILVLKLKKGQGIVLKTIDNSNEEKRRKRDGLDGILYFLQVFSKMNLNINQ